MNALCDVGTSTHAMPNVRVRSQADRVAAWLRGDIDQFMFCRAYVDINQFMFCRAYVNMDQFMFCRAYVNMDQFMFCRAYVNTCIYSDIVKPLSA